MWIETLTTENIHIADGIAPSPLVTTDKWGLIQSLHDLLCQREKITPELAAEIHKELLEREKLMSTGIGEQMAIPHAVIPGACRFMTEVAIIRQGMEFESLDATKAFIVVMLVAPKSALQEHLKVMATIAKVFYNAQTRQRVIAASDPTEALAAIRASV